VKPILVGACGAVTPVGLTARQTCAAIRAGLTGFADTLIQAPPDDPIVCATVPARRFLKVDLGDWLVRLASRAVRECLRETEADSAQLALLVALPELYREHVWERWGPERFLEFIEARLKTALHPESVVLAGGSAACYQLLKVARTLLDRGVVRYCVVGGVDSLANDVDAARLAATNRLHSGAANPQGVIPGEGAAFVLVSRDGRVAPPLAQVLGVGLAQERDPVLGDRFSTGIGMGLALRNALQEGACLEPHIDLRVSDMNGERYRAWESMISTTRFYRTHRERLITWHVAASVGDTGAASGALGLVTACVGMLRGYAPGPLAMLEAASDQGLRAACLVSAPADARRPPFHNE